MDFRYLSCLAVVPLVVMLSACETSTPAGDGNRGAPEATTGYYPDSRATRRAPREEPRPEVEAPAPEQPPARTATAPSHWPTMAGTDDRMNWSAMAYPTGSAATSVVGIEKGMPFQVNLDQEFEYHLIVTNLTRNVLTDVSVTEEYGRYFEMISSNPDATTKGDETATWAIGTLDPRESRTIRVRGRGVQTGNITSCASVTYASLLCMGIPVVAPDLELAISGPSEVLRCDDIVYTITVSNPGSGAVDNVTVRHPLPNGLTTLDGRNRAEFNAGRLEPGQSQTFTVPVQASRTGTFENEAVAQGSGLTAESGAIETVIREPDLEITRSCPELRFVGRNIDVEIVVANVGEGVARDVVVEDTIPAGAEVVSIGQGGQVAGDRVVWSVDSLAPDRERTFTVTYNPTTIDTYRGTSTARAYCAEAVSESCTTRVEGIPALLLEGFDDPDPVEVGNTTTYTLIVTNQGSADLTGIELVGKMEGDDTMEFVSAEGSSPARNFTGNADGLDVNFPTVARLAPGARATYRVTVRALKPGQVSFRAEAVSNEITRPLIKVETTNFYE